MGSVCKSELEALQSKAYVVEDRCDQDLYNARASERKQMHELKEQIRKLTHDKEEQMKKLTHDKEEQMKKLTHDKEKQIRKLKRQLKRAGLHPEPEHLMRKKLITTKSDAADGALPKRSHQKIANNLGEN